MSGRPDLEEQDGRELFQRPDESFAQYLLRILDVDVDQGRAEMSAEAMIAAASAYLLNRRGDEALVGLLLDKIAVVRQVAALATHERPIGAPLH